MAECVRECMGRKRGAEADTVAEITMQWVSGNRDSECAKNRDGFLAKLSVKKEWQKSPDDIIAVVGVRRGQSAVAILRKKQKTVIGDWDAHLGLVNDCESQRMNVKSQRQPQYHGSRHAFFIFILFYRMNV